MPEKCYDWGEDQWRAAKKLISAGRPQDAERYLIEAERGLVGSVDQERTIGLFLAQSRLYLYAGQGDIALERIERAIGLSNGSGGPKVGVLLLQRGLVYLVVGKELQAHEDISQYLEIAESSDDWDAQARGHFYLGLTYERHGEPCMAAADIEMGRDLARHLVTPQPYARMTSFLAHLWLRRGTIDEAKTLITTALGLFPLKTDQPVSLCWGMVQLVNAEVLAFESDWAGSSEAFSQAIQAFRADPLVHRYYEGLAYSWYGETLLMVNRSDEGCQKLDTARSLFEMLKNQAQVERAMRIQANGACPSCPGWADYPPSR